MLSITALRDKITFMVSSRDKHLLSAAYTHISLRIPVALFRSSFGQGSKSCIIAEKISDLFYLQVCQTLERKFSNTELQGFKMVFY